MEKEKNYKDEKYFNTTINLLAELDKIAETLVQNFKTEGKSYPVQEILEAKSFEKLWQVQPNNHTNRNAKKEYRGVYAFATVDKDNINFEYIGISQTTKRRFKSHTKRTTSGESSWAYLMIKHENPNLTTRELRTEKIKEYQQKRIHPLRFTFCPVDDNMLLHIAEVYCVNKLKSHWNSFETH